jgi:hypothetical protein
MISGSLTAFPSTQPLLFIDWIIDLQKLLCRILPLLGFVSTAV